MAGADVGVFGWCDDTSDAVCACDRLEMSDGGRASVRLVVCWFVVFCLLRTCAGWLMGDWDSRSE